MRADALNPGRNYAYIDPDFPGDPVRATVVTEPDDGAVHIQIHHPDTGADELTVATRTLHGAWEDEPDGNRWKAAVREVRESGLTPDWENVAELRIALIRRQRALASRLRAVTGIIREPAPYAGRGGAGGNAQHAKLQLNFDELEDLLSRVENGTAYTPRPRPTERSDETP